MKTAHEKYLEYLSNSHSGSHRFFSGLAQHFNLPIHDSVVFDIWYAPQRSWYQPEMMDFIARGQHIDAGVCLSTGDFVFDTDTGFIHK